MRKTQALEYKRTILFGFYNVFVEWYLALFVHVPCSVLPPVSPLCGWQKRSKQCSNLTDFNLKKYFSQIRVYVVMVIQRCWPDIPCGWQKSAIHKVPSMLFCRISSCFKVREVWYTWVGAILFPLMVPVELQRSNGLFVWRNMILEHCRLQPLLGILGFGITSCVRLLWADKGCIET